MRNAADLPYLLHTNRELGLMLRGEKPLAVFCDGHDAFPDAVLRYLRMFDRHVAAGRFIKREYVLPEPSNRRVRGWHTILFALPHEGWRIDEMIALRLQDEWSPANEREEGRLLGYADWQSDVWMSRFYGR